MSKPLFARRFLFIAASALLLSGIARPVFAADAAQVLKEAAAAIAAQNTFALTITVKYNGKFQGSEEGYDTDYVIAFDRANGLSIHLNDMETEMFIYRNATEYARYMPAFKQYIVESPDKTAEEILSISGTELTEPAMRCLSTFVSAAPFTGAFTPENLSYVGSEEQEGQACDRIRFTAAGFTYDVWIDAAPSRLVRRIEPDMAPLEKQYGDQYGTTFDFTVAAAIGKWDAAADVSKMIAFAAPEGVEKVAQFMPPRPLSEAEMLVGSAAPDFTLPLLAGGELALSKQKGSVVILDFWATWCGPCRVAMPALHQIAKEFDGKGVKVFSVNKMEEPEQIKEFLTQMNLTDIAVALDSDNTVSESYKADGIPQTVIIDAEGNVRVVHVGLWAFPTDDPAETVEEQEKQIHKVLADALRKEINEVLGKPSAD